MSTTQVRVASTALLFLIILLSGISLSTAGKPYGTLVFSVHKLVGVGAAVLLAVIIYQAHRAGPLSSLETAAVIVTATCFALTVIAGGLWSIPRSMPPTMLKLHQITPAATMLSTAASLYLLLSGK